MSRTVSIREYSTLPFFEWLNGPIRWELLMAGLELSLYDYLRRPVAVATLAQQTDLHADTLQPWLRAMTASGVLQREHQGWVLAPWAAPFLDRQSPRFIGPTLVQLSRVRQATAADIVERLRHGPRPAADQPLRSPQFWRQASANLQAFQRALAVPFCLDLLPDLLPASIRTDGAGAGLDLGAGSAELALALCARHPDLTMTVFDLPACIDALSEQVGAQPRLQLVGGDYNDTLPAGPFDLIWCAMALYYARDLTALIRRLRERLQPGGVLISLHEGLSAHRTAPELHVIGRSWPALQGVDVSMDSGRIARAMTAAGCSDVTLRALASPWGPLELTVGRH